MNGVAFIIIAVFTLAGALAAATLPNLMHAAFCLVVALLGLASLFFLLGAEFVGLALVFIYVGAVAVLVVFTILLTRRDSKEHHRLNWSARCFRRFDVGGSKNAIAVHRLAAHSGTNG